MAYRQNGPGRDPLKSVFPTCGWFDLITLQLVFNWFFFWRKCFQTLVENMKSNNTFLLLPNPLPGIRYKSDLFDPRFNIIQYNLSLQIDREKIQILLLTGT